MSTPRFAKLATDLIAEEGEPRAPSSEAEIKAVAAIEDALARRRRARRTSQIVGVMAAAAVIAAVFGGWLSRREPHAHVAPGPSSAPAPTPTPSSSPASTPETMIAAQALEPAEGAVVARDGRTASLAPSMSLASGDRIESSPKGGTGIALADGSLVRIDPGSEISVKALSDTRRFLLSRGSLRADVAKLGPAQRFIVETEDAEVEVHGTSFRVAIREGSRACPARTQVEVTEGVVSVRSAGVDVRLGPGSSWPACAAPAPRPDLTTMRAPERAPDSSPRVSDTGARRGSMPESSPLPAAGPVAAPATSSATSSHALAEQNELFAKASAARRAGDGPAAVAAYDRLIATHPDGFLAESAAVERMRVLEGMSHARGREAAAAYLARYPNGFARVEAQRLAQ